MNKQKPYILFVVPPALPYHELKQCGSIGYDTYLPTSIPLGVLSLCAYVRKNHSIALDIMDYNILVKKYMSSYERFSDLLMGTLKEHLKGKQPNLIAISALFNSNYLYLKEISTTVKNLFSDVYIVAGGGLPTNMFKEILKNIPEIDAICFGEGEIPLNDLLSSNDWINHFNKNRSWITLEKLHQGFQPEASYINNLDEIPPLDYDLIDFDSYASQSRSHGNTDLTRALSVMTTRGCPYQCTFCASHSVHGRKIRMRSTDHLLSEIEDIILDKGIQTILIEDDHFLVNKTRARNILKGLKRLNVKIEFPNGLLVNAIDEQIAHELKDAGVEMVTLAIESGSEYVLKNIIHKPLNLNQVKLAVQILKNLDLYIRAFFVIGFPGETKKHIDETKQFIKETGFNWVAIMIASPIAGSMLFKLCKENGYLVSEQIEDYHFGKANIRTEHFTPTEIEAKRYHMNLELNFVNNFDMKIGRYDRALIGFLDVLKRVPNHAFAHYFVSICFRMLSMKEKESLHHKSYLDILAKDEKWRRYAKDFKL